MPTYTEAGAVQVGLSFDAGVTYSANAVAVLLIEAPAILRLNGTAALDDPGQPTPNLNGTDHTNYRIYYTFNERVYIQLTGQHLRKGEYLYVRVGDQVQRIPTSGVSTATSGEESIVFEMPAQLDLGAYPIAVSTDGLNYRPDGGGDEAFWATILQCPDGYYCEAGTARTCPDGYFCPHGEPQMFQPRECPLGTYMTEEGAGECSACPAGSYCPDVRLYVAQACPVGFLCGEESQHSLAQLWECPAGYVCPAATASWSLEDPSAAPTMTPCPPGHFCPEGTTQAPTQYGNFTTPQVCKDGTVCSPVNPLHANYTESGTEHIAHVNAGESREAAGMPGATTQYGNYQC